MILPVNGTCRGKVINWPGFYTVVSQGLRRLRRETDGSVEQSGYKHILDGNVHMIPGTPKQLQDKHKRS